MRVVNQLLQGKQVPITIVQPMIKGLPAWINYWHKTTFLGQLHNHGSIQLVKPDGGSQEGEGGFLKGKIEPARPCFLLGKRSMEYEQKGDEFLHMRKFTIVIMSNLLKFAKDFILERIRRKYFLVYFAQIPQSAPRFSEGPLITKSKTYFNFAIHNQPYSSI